LTNLFRLKYTKNINLVNNYPREEWLWSSTVSDNGTQKGSVIPYSLVGWKKFLKAQNPQIKVIGVEPASPNHRLPGLKRITGLTEELIPKIPDRSVIDDRVEVADEHAYRTAIALARKDGIPVGPTTGAILHLALQYVKLRKGLAVIISPDDAFKYTSFYKDYLEIDGGQGKSKQWDLSDLVCPLSKIKATEVLDSLDEGETVRIILGNTDSLTSVAQEIKVRGLRPDFERQGENHFVLTVTKS